MAAFVAVEAMRGGASPQQACEAAVMRMMKDKAAAAVTCQVTVLALSRSGTNYPLPLACATAAMIDGRCNIIPGFPFQS